MTLRTSPRFASGWERVGPTRSANRPPYPEMQLFSVDVDDAPAQGFLFPQPPFRWAWGRFLKRDAPSAGRSADPLRRVLLPGNLYRWSLPVEGRII